MMQELWRDVFARRFGTLGWGRATLRMAVTPEPPLTSGGGGGAATTEVMPPVTPTAPAPVQAPTIVNGLLVGNADRHPGLDKTKADTIQWSTADDQGYTLVFMNQGWPFVEPPQFIEVPRHGKSAVFTVLANIPSGPYAYVVYTGGVAVGAAARFPGRVSDPPPGPPDPPTVDIGP